MKSKRSHNRSNVFHNWSIVVLPHHTVKPENEFVSVKSEIRTCKPRSLERDYLTLILLFLQLAQPLRLLGWLFRETISYVLERKLILQDHVDEREQRTQRQEAKGNNQEKYFGRRLRSPMSSIRAPNGTQVFQRDNEYQVGARVLG